MSLIADPAAEDAPAPAQPAAALPLADEPAAAPVATGHAYTSMRAAWLPLLALCLAFFVEMVDNTLMTIALPTIARDLGSGTTGLQWVSGAYSLTFGGLLLTAGFIADRFGRRRVLLIGLAAFGLISLLVAVVSTTGELIALRALLGVAAAMMAPITTSLIFRLFDDDTLRMRAITLMMIVGMSGFVVGPVLGGTVLAHMRWEWLLLVNAPIALIAWIGVRVGIQRDDPAGLTAERLDVPGSLLSIASIGLACYTLTAGVDFGWTSWQAIASGVGAIVAIAAFLLRERTAAAPMLDLGLFRRGTVRGAAIAQVATAIAMTGIMFALILHFQYAFGWSPMRAGLANIPIMATMILASPLVESLIQRVGQRIACMIGAVFLAGGMAGMAWATEHGYLVIATFMVVMTIGLRTIQTTCAVALVAAMPENRTSIGAALNDTAQEVGTSVGTALVGTLIAALVTAALPSGTWSTELVTTYFHGERIIFIVLAIAVGILAMYGSSTLTNSRASDEHAV